MTELEQLKNSKTFTEAIKIVFGKNYINGRLKNELAGYVKSKYDLDIVEIIKNNNKCFCAYCGKEIKGKNKTSKRFCCSSCAAKYNNAQRGPRSEKTKRKISESLKLTNAKNTKSTGIRDEIHNRFYYEHVCENCGKHFLTTKVVQKYCSTKCAHNSEKYKEKLRNTMLKKVANGSHSGWKSRKISSYAEKFWEDVLKNNSIEFVREDFSTKKYFLDFLIIKNGKRIDLEIDGKQHNIEERKKHDSERDKFLTENGYIVYRIPWNSVNTESGKEKMKLKIENFLSFYKNV